MLRMNFVVFNSETCLPIRSGVYRGKDDLTVADFKEYITKLSFAPAHLVRTIDVRQIRHDKALVMENFLTNLVPQHNDWSDLVFHYCAICDDDDPLSELPSDPAKIFLGAYCEFTTKPKLTSIKEDGGCEERTLEEIVASIKEANQSPSEAAKLEAMAATQHTKNFTAIYNGRPMQLTGPEVAIYHPVFARFVRAIQKPSVEDLTNISHADKENAAHLILYSASWYEAESLRHDIVGPYVEHFLGPGSAHETTFHSGVGGTTYRPGGHVFIVCSLCNAGGAAPVEITELKNGLGLGECDPADQAAKGYMLASVDPRISRLRRISCLPTFLLSIIGAHVAVSGAIFLDGVVSQYLTDYISLVPRSNVSFDDHVKSIAHLLSTLRSCSEELKTYYTSLRPSAGPSTALLPAPHFSSFVMDGQTYRLTYIERVFKERKDCKRAVFRAVADAERGGSSMQCVVKFCTRYGDQVHRLVYKEGLAPRLLYCEFEPSVGMKCVVTEYIDQSSVSRPTRGGLERLRAVLRVMEDASFVHGDLREGNVIWDGQDHPYLIDFDWSGQAGAVQYPWTINEEIDWAGGVIAGGNIEIQHDKEMLDKLIDRVSLVD